MPLGEPPRIADTAPQKIHIDHATAFPSKDSNVPRRDGRVYPVHVWELRFDCGHRAARGPQRELVAIVESGDRGDTERSHLAHHRGGHDWSPILPDRVRDDPPIWVVRRIDDNGNVFEVDVFSLRCGADALAAELTARGHKQTYWVQRTA